MATEQFREWKFKTQLKIRYTDGSTGQKQIWVKGQQELLDQKSLNNQKTKGVD